MTSVRVKNRGLFRSRCADHDGKNGLPAAIERDVNRGARGNIQRTFFDIINKAEISMRGCGESEL